MDNEPANCWKNVAHSLSLYSVKRAVMWYVCVYVCLRMNLYRLNTKLVLEYQTFKIIRQFFVRLLVIIILVLPPGVVCPSNRALPMLGTLGGDAVSHCQVLGRAGSVHHGADQ